MAIFSKDELDIYSQPLPEIDWESRFGNEEQQRGRGGFPTSLISEGGAVGGAALGTALLPGIGTIVGGGLGAVLGRLGENKVRDDRWGVGDALKEGTLETALLGAGKAFKAVKGARAAAKGLGAADDVAKGASRVGRAGRRIEQAGNDLLGTQANLTRPELRKIGVVRPGDVIGEVQKRTGIKNLDTAATVASNVTGSNGVYSELVRNAVGNTPGVDIGDLRRVADDLLTNKAALLTPSQRRNVVEQVKNTLVKSYGGSGGSLNPLANPLEAFESANMFRGLARQLDSVPTKTEVGKQLSSVYKGLAEAIEKRLYSAPGLDEGIRLAIPDRVADLRKLAARAASKSERTAYNKLADELSKVKNIRQARSLQKAFVDVSNIDEATARAMSGAGARVGDQMQGLGKLVQRPTNMVAVPLNAATPTAGAAAARVGRAMQGVGDFAQISGQAGRALSGARSGAGASLVESLINPGAPVEPQQPQALEGELLAGGGGAGTMGGGQMGQLPSAATNSIFAPENAEAGVASILQQGGDFEDVEQYLSLVEALQGLSGGAGGGGLDLNNTAITAISDTQAGLDQLDKLAETYRSSSANNPVIGRLRGLNPFDTDAQAFDSQLRLTRQIIGKALEGGVLRKEDEAKYSAILPNRGDTDQAALAKLEFIRNDIGQKLQTFIQNQGQFGGGGTSLDDVLMGAQPGAMY